MNMNVCYILALLLFLSSCASVEPVKEKSKVLQPVDIVSPVMPQTEKARRIEIEGPKEVFSFSLRDADVKDVLRAISKQTNYNIIIEPDVKGVCTVDLKNVTLNKAIEYILEPLNYSFKIEDRSIYVSKPKIEMRIFTLNYITLNKTGIGFISGATSTGRTTTQAGGTVTGSTSGAVSGGTGATTATGGGSANIVVSTGTESDLWRDIENNIKNFLSPEGKFILNRQASVIMVMDYPKSLKNIALFLETVEGTVQRQVMIEAKIVEVMLTEESKEGINWSLIGAQWQGFALNIEQALVVPQTKLFNIPKIDDLTKLNAPEQYVRFGVGRGRFDSFIDLLRTQGKINIVSSPKIATLNNQRAVIKVATEDVFFETTTTVTSGSPAVTTQTPKYVTIGLVLDVVPQIDNQGNIVMNIHPMLTEKLRTAESTVGGTKVTAPVLSVREVDTLVKVREGESIIIGGLIKDFSTSDEQGVKGLMSIPGLGNFFKTQTNTSYRTELVIFLTPRIIYGKDAP